jgi:hypothetical protein
VVSRGKTCRITLVGSELAGATGLWTSLSAKEITADLARPSSPDQAEFDVTVGPDAPLGLYGLRLATRSGLSNVKLLLIDDLPTVPEADTRPPGGPPQHLNWPLAVVGQAREADIDRYLIEVEAGQRLTFEVVGSRLGQDFDPVVTVKDARGKRVVERDNDVGLMFDCRFAHTFETAGTYTIEVQDSRFRGSDHLVYVLRVGRFPEARSAIPSAARTGDTVALTGPGSEGFTQHLAVASEKAPGVYFQELRRPGDQGSAWVPLQVTPYPGTMEHEPNDAPSMARPIEIPIVVHGAITSAGDRDAFSFDLAPGQKLKVDVECRPLGSPADLDVTLVGPDGKPVKRLDTLPDGAATLDVQAKVKGRHVLLVRSLTGEGGPEYVYRITIAPREPGVRLVSDASALAIPRGSYQPLPLSLTRIDFAGPVDLELRGAPTGMSLSHPVVPAGETEFDDAIVVADSVPEGVYSVQVVAKTPSNGPGSTSVATTLPLIDRLPTGRGPHGEPFELREDQRRLPPTLTDRIAVEVTSPSPYTFELPDRSVVLPRYLESSFRLDTTRVEGFDAPITFTARGGTLDPLNLQKPRVLAEIAAATREQKTVSGVLRSGVNSELRKHRVTVTAHAEHDGRVIDLTRTFELQTKLAYEPSAEPQKLEVVAGESAEVSVRANSLAPFTGPVTIRPAGVEGWSLPEAVELAEGADVAKLTFVVPKETKPGTYRITLPGSARVSKFNEAVVGKPVEVVVVEPRGDGS